MRRREAAAALVEACADLIEALSLKARHRERLRMEKALQPKIAKAFRAQGRAFLKGFAATKPLLQEAIREDDWEPIWDRAAEATRQLFVGPIDDWTKAALAAGARRVIKEVEAGIGFDLKNPRAVAYLKDRAAERVSMVEDTTKAQIRSIIVKGQEAGQSWEQIARSLRDRFKEFAVGKPQAHVDSRAHLIAMTEIGEAYTEGNLQGAQELQDVGLQMEKSWSTVGDDRVSDGCLANAADGWIPLAQAFSSGHQRPLRFPGCRCDLLTRRKRDK